MPLPMPGAFKDHFSRLAGEYRAFRPGYPPALVEWLAGVSPARERAVDLGCGSGQATRALALHFGEVIGVDASAEQIAHAETHPRISYRVARAEATGLPPACADLVVVAQALHWLDLPAVVAEVERIARPGAAFAAFTYGLCRVDPAVDRVVARLSLDVLGACWPPERAHVDAGYAALPLPWPALVAPALTVEEAWTLPRFLGHLGTWSAASVYRERRGEDPVALVARELAAAWGPPGRARAVRWDLATRAARVGRR